MNEMNALFHRHLVAAYTVTWLFHLCYLGYVAMKWQRAKREIDR